MKALEIRALAHSFDHLPVLRDINLSVAPGEVHALIGFNGAGKSTLMRAALGMLLHVLAMTSSSYKKLSDAANIATLSVSLVLLASFPFWMDYQTRRGKPALIPNSLWKNWSFTSVCIAVFFCWASLNGIEYFTTL